MKKRLGFFTLTKVDLEQGLVWGVATEEVVDKSGEVFDYASSKPYFEKWSADISKATGGLSLGNVREMHTAKAAGRLEEIVFDDDAKRITVCAKVVDVEAINKVAEGVYTGFSIGGRYVKRWKDGDVTKYTADPSEISLVDNPCLGTAHFTMTKADGSEVEVALRGWQPTNEEVAAEATAMAKAAGDETKWADHVEEARTSLIEKRGAMPEDGEDEPVEDAPEDAGGSGDGAGTGGPAGGSEGAAEDPASSGEDAVDKAAPAEPVQVWQTADGRTFAKKADAVEHSDTLSRQSRLDKAVAGLRAALGKTEPSRDVGALAQVAVVADAYTAVRKAWDDHVMAKSLWLVSDLASALSSLRWIADCAICEEGWEPGTSEVPGKLLEHIRGLAEVLVLMAQEETEEMLADLRSIGVTMEVFSDGDADAEKMVVVADGLSKSDTGVTGTITVTSALLEKVGARNSRVDGERIQTIHDKAAELGAACTHEEDATKLAKFSTMEQENTALKKQMDEVAENVEFLTKEVARLRDTPLPAAPRSLHAISKGQDNGGSGADLPKTAEELGPYLKGLGFDDDAIAKAVIRMSQTQGVPAHGVTRG